MYRYRLLCLGLSCWRFERRESPNIAERRIYQNPLANITTSAIQGFIACSISYGGLSRASFCDEMEHAREERYMREKGYQLVRSLWHRSAKRFYSA